MISGRLSPLISATAGPLKNCQSSITRGKAGSTAPVVAFQAERRWSKRTGGPEPAAEPTVPLPLTSATTGEVTAPCATSGTAFGLIEVGFTGQPGAIAPFALMT